MKYELQTKSGGIGNRNKSRFPFSIKIIVVIVVILGIFHFFMPKVLPSLITAVVRPLWRIAPVDKEVEDLKIELSRNQNLYAQTNFLIQENEELKTMLGRSVSSTSPRTKILAQILKKPPVSAYDIFIIDIGNDKNLKSGDKVYAMGNIPIGEIEEVEAYTSKVKLYSSPGEKFEVFVGKKNIQATAIGKGGGVFEVSLPRDTSIEKGEPVSIPSISDSFVGEVGTIVSEPSEPFSTLLFNLPFNIYELRWVLVDHN